jgi:hypothetical protein
LPADAVDGAGVLLRGIVIGPIDPDQSWFWTPQWQDGEREAERTADQSVTFASNEEFLTHLEQLASDTSE